MKVKSNLLGLLIRPFRISRATVLQRINAARNALGLATLDNLPKGVQGRPLGCPIGRALAGMVGVSGVAFSSAMQAINVAGAWNSRVLAAANGNFVVALPHDLQRFVRDFDLGAYPMLVA